MSYEARTYSHRDEEAGDGSFKNLTEPKECLEDFRRKWIPGLNWVFNSGADLAGDWYYLYTVYSSFGGGVDNLDINENLDLLVPLLAVTLVSTLMFLMVFITYCAKAGDQKRDVCCVDALKRFSLKCCCCWKSEMRTITFISLIEDIFEDIPTIALTYMIDLRRRGEITPSGVLNITTSVFNLVYNIIFALTPKDKTE